MNPFSDNFVNYDNYDDFPIDISKPTDQDFSLTSPNSDSTTLYPNHYSPEEQADYPLENKNSENNQSSESNSRSKRKQSTQRKRGVKVEHSDSASLKIESIDDDSGKTDRILKRTIAKQRAKTKHEALSIFKGVDSKYLPEGYDDPDLDDKTKKKMVQMVRNRISAQNSRDRKKNFMQQLEDANNKLIEEKSILQQEKAILLDEIRGLKDFQAQLLEENQTLKQNTVCNSCQRSHSTVEFIQNVEEDQHNSTEESLAGGFSGLNSPILNRFPSAGRGFLTFFTFATLLSVIAVVNIQQKGEVLLQHDRNSKDTRLLEYKNEYCQKLSNISIQEPKALDPRELVLDPSFALATIKPLKSNFEMNYNVAFKTHLQSMASLENRGESTSIMQFEQPKFENAIVDPNYFQAANLRKKNPTIVARDLPVLRQNSNDEIQASTLFCPSGYELFDSKNEDANIDEEEIQERGLSLEKTEYLQLFVPRHSIARYDVKNNISNLYGLPLYKGEESDNSMLEIWCKVFLIRDVSSTF